MVNFLILGVVSFGIAFFLGQKVVKRLTKNKIEQVTRLDGPKSHYKKNGTPTMGGVIFIVPVIGLLLVVLLLGSGIEVASILIFLASFIGYAAIGFADDLLKVRRKKNEGLSSKQKMLLQFGLFLVLVWALINNGFDTSVYSLILNREIELGWFYYVLVFFMLVGGTNATNLTDGLDGLLTTNAMINLFGFLIVLVLINQNLEFAYVAMIMIGALGAFWLFNRYPAKIFMGDTGSLAIGAALAIMAILTGMETLLFWFSIVYIIETISVMIQVGCYKLKRRRVFKMAPIHHHFELLGWSENKIIVVSNLVTLTFVMVGIGLLIS